MKLIRLKISDPNGFRSLQPGFEHIFRSHRDLKKEEQIFEPFICAGPNGSGKSNLLEVLAAIFFQLEILRVHRSFLPENFLYDEENNPTGYKESDGKPCAYELEYLIKVPTELQSSKETLHAHVKVKKEMDKSPDIKWLNASEFKDTDHSGSVGEKERDFLLPEFVLGYSSGENEILSLPFFKMRFIQFDEYWHSLKHQLPYSGRPETRMAYMDNAFSQAILLCTLLFNDQERLKPFHEDVGIGELKEFRIIIKRQIKLNPNENADLPEELVHSEENDDGSKQNSINLIKLLEADENSASNFDPIVTRLKRCATCTFIDESTNTLYLDYFVNKETKKAFRLNFENSAIALFQAFQVLLTLNLYSVNEHIKRDLYNSNSHYVNETVPTLASDERIMRFKFVRFIKNGISETVTLKDLSDGEHQFLHSLGLCLLFGNTNSLFLLDEPETHFNPDWRSKFISRLNECLPESTSSDHEMLITTHSPFLISDSAPKKVLVFEKTNGKITIANPDYNTLGASINKITMNTFGKRETIGGRAEAILKEIYHRFNEGEDRKELLKEINQKIGDSVEKVLLIKTILDSMEEEAQD